jgi:hypothetical protein
MHALRQTVTFPPIPNLFKSQDPKQNIFFVVHGAIREVSHGTWAITSIYPLCTLIFSSLAIPVPLQIQSEVLLVNLGYMEVYDTCTMRNRLDAEHFPFL